MEWHYLTVEAFARGVGAKPAHIQRAIDNRERMEVGAYTGYYTLYAVRDENGQWRIPIALLEDGSALVFTTRTNYERYRETNDECYGYPLSARTVLRILG